MPRSSTGAFHLPCHSITHRIFLYHANSILTSFLFIYFSSPICNVGWPSVIDGYYSINKSGKLNSIMETTRPSHLYVIRFISDFSYSFNRAKCGLSYEIGIFGARSFCVCHLLLCSVCLRMMRHPLSFPSSLLLCGSVLLS